MSSGIGRAPPSHLTTKTQRHQGHQGEIVPEKNLEFPGVEFLVVLVPWCLGGEKWCARSAPAEERGWPELFRRILGALVSWCLGGEKWHPGGER
jgi:hypothetical protein